jgi:hypothetical protein
LKGVEPKAGIKIGPIQHGTEAIADGLVRTFHGAVLVRSIGSRGIDIIVEFLLEKGTDGRAVVQFTTLIEHDILVVGLM